MMSKKRAFFKLAPFFFWLILISQFMLFSGPQIASADLWSDQEGMTSDIGPKAFGNAGAPKDIREVVANVISVFLGLLGIMFLALIVLAGYKWMMAQGDSSKVDEAKDQLRTSTIGLAIILAAWGITTFVTCAILKATDSSLIWCPV